MQYNSMTEYMFIFARLPIKYSCSIFAVFPVNLLEGEYTQVLTTKQEKTHKKTPM